MYIYDVHDIYVIGMYMVLLSNLLFAWLVYVMNILLIS